jgi:hypothetical protein
MDWFVGVVRWSFFEGDRLPQIEFGSLYKFVASIGLVLIVAAVVVPWILLQSTDVLLISKRSIAGLPDSAGQAIERRQVLVAWAQDQLPVPIFVVLALAGLFLLGWALFKWVPSQQRSDANEQIALQKSEVEFQKLSSHEVDEKLKEEVAETNPVPLDEATSPPAATEAPADRGTPSGSAGGEPSSSIAPDAPQKPEEPDRTVRHGGPEAAEDSRERSRRLIEQLRATEAQVARLFQEAFEGAFKVEREVKITSGAARGRVLDILLDPDGESRAQLGVEIRRFGSQIMPDRLNELLTRAAITTQDLSAGTVFTGARGRPREAKASGILVLVLNGEGFAANAFRIQRHVPVINSVMKRPVGVVVIPHERLDSVQPGELREAVASVWAEPDQIATLSDEVSRRP